MTIRHMRILLYIVNSGSMAAAAEMLHLSQPALSLAVKEMEHYYGVKLFDRIGRGLSPTEEGRRMAEYAARIVELFDGMETALRDPEAHGRLRVGASITVGNCLMPDWAAQFARAHPSVTLAVTVEDSESLEACVASGALDLAVIEGVVHEEVLTRHEVMRDELLAACGVHHPLAASGRCTLAQFAQQDILTREPGSAVRALLEGALLSSGLTASPKWQSVSTQALIQAAARGLGVALLPRLLAAPHIGAGTLCPLEVEGLELTRSFSLIHHKDKYLGIAARAFIDLVLGRRG